MKKFLKFLMIPLGMCMMNSCAYYARYIYLNFPDVNDYKHLPSKSIHTNPERASYPFAAGNDFQIEKIMPVQVAGKEIWDMNKFLRETKTTSFIIIRNDTVLFEQYNYGHSRITPVKTFSVSKNIVSMLIGLAILEGKIESVHDPIVKYIPEITDKQLKNLTIQHCLSLVSGIRADQGEIWPWNTKVKIYYSRDIRKLCYGIRYENEPGKVFHVEEMTPVLLGLVIERATGMSVSSYLEEKIWKQLGMAENALWVTDRRKDGFEAINSGLTATPMDLARIGSLYLKLGRWDGKSIVSEEWIRSSTAPDTTSVSFWHNIQAYRNSDVYFNDMWWGLRNKDGNYEYSANGHFGQRIYMVPEKNLLILRFGMSAGHTDWTAFIQALSEKL